MYIYAYVLLDKPNALKINEREALDEPLIFFRSYLSGEQGIWMGALILPLRICLSPFNIEGRFQEIVVGLCYFIITHPF